MSTLASIISWVLQIYAILILIRVLLSWINSDPYRPVIRHRIVDILHQITDPVLLPLQRIIPPIGGTIDISPIVALIILEIARRIIVSFVAGL